MTTDLRHYIYFDAPGIERLIKQTFSLEEREVVINTVSKISEAKKRAVSPKLSATVVAAGFELAGAREDNEQYDLVNEKKRTLFQPNEQKLLQLEEYICANDNYISITSIADAHAISTSLLPAFCHLKKFPFIVKAPSGTRACEDALREQLVLMEAPQVTTHSAKLFVAAGLSKFDSTRYVTEKDEYQFGKTSHLSILLRSMVLEPTPLGVFGHIRVVLGNLHVKPYAIWF